MKKIFVLAAVKECIIVGKHMYSLDFAEELTSEIEKLLQFNV